MERTGESVGGESVGNALPPRWYMSLVGLFLFCPLWGTVERMELEPAMDSTLFSEDSSAANGAGEVLFVGRIKRGPSYRRVLLGFDLEGIPSNSLIENVTLRITTRHNPWSSEAFVLHRLTRAWGEGLSDSAVSPIGPSIGKGAPAEESDATWSHALFGGTMWSIPGGDYVAENSAVATMEGTGSTAEWSSAQMVADVRDWLENPRSNFGWILKGPEGGTTTVRWLHSRETPDPAHRPSLVVDYTDRLELRTEHFDGGPGFLSVSEGSDTEGFDFGWSASNLAGGAEAGELGGLFSGSMNASSHYFGDLEIGEVSRFDRIEISGRFVVEENLEWEGWLHIGFVNLATAMENPQSEFQNQLGIAVTGPAEESESFLVMEISNLSDSGREFGTPTSVPLSTQTAFEFLYEPDPSESGNGCVRLALTLEDDTVLESLIEDFRIPEPNDQSFDAFIVGSVPFPASESGGQMRAFFDDLTYSVRPFIEGGKLDQDIVFGALPDRSTNDAPFALTATASSGLPVSFAIVSGPAAIDGSTVTLTGEEGFVSIRASQSGNEDYNPTPRRVRFFRVSKPIGNSVLGAEGLGEGFFVSDWYGVFNPSFFPWVFHVGHGWQYIIESEIEGEYFIYDLECSDFWWTKAAFEPLTFFSFNRGTFNFYFVGSANPRQFVDLATGEFWSKE